MSEISDLDAARAHLAHLEVFAEGEDVKRVRAIIAAFNRLAAEARSHDGEWEAMRERSKEDE